MLIKLIKFEWFFHSRKLLFPLAVICFAFFGFMITAGGMKLPKVNSNAPYMISYALSIASMGAIFVAALFGANSILRDWEHKMTEMVYATPVKKLQFLTARFTGTILASVLAFSGVALGMIAVLFTPLVDQAQVGDINLWHYLWNMLVIVLPNILVCASLIFLIGTISRHRISIYVGGFAIYVFYMAAGVFTGAPWLANASPASAEAMSLAAIFDPLGISAFYEQTDQWSNLQRNTQLISLQGNFLINRLFWVSISFVLLLLSYKIFNFRTLKKVRKKETVSADEAVTVKTYQPVAVQLSDRLSDVKSFLSLLRIEVTTILKSIPFLVTMSLWLFIIGMETFSMATGGTRMQGNYPLTGFMISNILEVFSALAMIVIIFYSSEQIFRNKSVQINELIDSSPVSSLHLYSSKFLALLLIPATMILLAVAIAVAAQISVGYYHFELLVYLKLVYYAGAPILIVVAIALFTQSLVSNKYVGMVLTGIIVFILGSQFGRLMGLEHLLFNIAVPFYGISKIGHSDFLGYGAYATAFHWRMIYGLAFAAILMLINIHIWNRGTSVSLLHRLKLIKSQAGNSWKILFGTAVMLFIGSGVYIFYQTNINNDYITRNERLDWMQQYEEKYRAMIDAPQPSIADVYSEIDLFPSEQRYEVRGKYLIVNNHKNPMDQALLSLSKVSEFRNLEINRAKITEDRRFGHYQVDFDKPLMPGDTLEMNFSFHSGWSPFSGHVPFNSIVENGSFMRISHYFPYFGYNAEREISNPDIRSERGLVEHEEEIKKLETDDYADYDYDFTNLEMKISTAGDQTVIFPGQLLSTKQENGRNHFHFKSYRPGPFRFAIASARYEVQNADYKGVAIEIYHHSNHAFNVDHLMTSVKQTLDYCTENYGPYQYDTFRYAEVSQFTEGFAATAYPHTIYNIEDKGFLSNQRDENGIDIILQLVAHEFGHQWWAGQVDPEYREGGIILTESLAQYTEIMLYEKHMNKRRVMDALNVELSLYLRGRGFEEERPLYKAKPGQPTIPYSKGIKVMYAIQDLIGEKQLNKALASLVENYAWPKLPPTSLDLLDAIYAVSPPETHSLIDDWMKRIVIYDLKTTDATVTETSDGQYEVTIQFETKRYEEDGNGVAKQIALNEDFAVGVFSGYDVASEKNTLYLEKHRFDSDNSELTITVNEKPEYVAIDPYIVMIDRNRTDNLMKID
ncbi:MAG: M1 family aminopeptidase [Bacteroidota bacterium]